MNGPEHYKRAEELLDGVAKEMLTATNNTYKSVVESSAIVLVAASVHAELAQVAATMELVGATVNGSVIAGWSEVLS